MARRLDTRSTGADLPRLILTVAATAAVDRCLRHLHQRDADAAGRAATTIAERLRQLERHPAIGRPVPDGLRELVIPFGSSGYVALYREDMRRDAVIILALRHQREAGYR